MRISDWSSDVCSSDLFTLVIGQGFKQGFGLFVRQMPHPNLAALAISLERRYLVDPLPFALGLAEDGANERHISVPRGVRRFGQAGRQQPVDHIPAHLVEPLAAKMGGEPADTLHILPAGLLVRLLLHPPQSRLVPGPDRES